MDQYYTWGSLGSFAGATAAVLLIVQYLKLPIDKIGHIPTRAVVLAVSLVIQFGVALFGGGEFAMQNIMLYILNAFLVALASMGAYENTFAKKDKNIEDQASNGTPLG